MRPMKAHADILRMCSSRKKRERIKWFVARDAFFDKTKTAFKKGLRLARECEHEDARFLLSLFPGATPLTREEVARVFLSQSEPRCQCGATQFEEQPNRELLKRSAEGGYAWGQFWYAHLCCEWFEQPQWMEKAIAQGERDAMLIMARMLWNGVRFGFDKPRAKALWYEAASLGLAMSQYEFAKSFRGADSPGRFVWLRRCTAQCTAGWNRGLGDLISAVVIEVERFQAGGSGRKVFEIGAAFAVAAMWRNWANPMSVLLAGERALQLYE